MNEVTASTACTAITGQEDTHDVLDMLRAYLTDIFPGGELKRSLRFTRVASTLVICTEMPQDIFSGAW